MNCLSYPQGILVVASDKSEVCKKNSEKLSSEVEDNKKTKLKQLSWVYCATNTAFSPGSRNKQFILDS